MSYRSIKRVLGETNLERKCRLLFGACLFVLITACFWWYGQVTEEIVWGRTPDACRQQVNAAVLKDHWKALDKEFPVDALVRQIDTENYERRVIRAGINDPSPNKLRQPLNELEEKLLEQWETAKEREPTPEEVEKPDAQAQSEQGMQPQGKAPKGTAARAQGLTTEYYADPPYYAFRDGSDYIYYQPVFITDSSCVICHRPTNVNQELTEGDLQAIIQIRVPTETVEAAISRNKAWLFAIAIITVFLAMIALYVIVRYVIVKPLRHLRDVSDEVSRGNTALRADIRTGDEFEHLAVAFNRMLQKILDSSAELRNLNDDLDGKVDQLAQTNMRLFEMNRLKSDFLATMSHELRTPLNSIIGFSDVLDSIDSLDNKQRRYVQNIQRSGRLLLDMINDILDLAKIESGKMELNLTDFPIDPIISAQCDMARPLAEKKNIDITTTVDPKIPELHQDQVKIQQVLNNLLSNAIKFTPEGGQISVTARLNKREMLELIVNDTGVGIAEPDKLAIFEKFRQGPTGLSTGDAMTREYSGTGLGLSIVKELCKLLGGEISLESELGKGSTFTVTLPTVRQEQPRLDSTLTSELDDMSRPLRFDATRMDSHRARIDSTESPKPAEAPSSGEGSN